MRRRNITWPDGYCLGLGHIVARRRASAPGESAGLARAAAREGRTAVRRSRRNDNVGPLLLL
jgi:hypothetical protein